MSELQLSDEFLDAPATAVAEKLAGGVPTSSSSRWITAAEAADYLRCSMARVRRLTGYGGLPSHRDGARVLYRQDELDRFVVNGGESKGRSERNPSNSAEWHERVR
jgi:excisionase family DNA binding protein